MEREVEGVRRRRGLGGGEEVRCLHEDEGGGAQGGGGGGRTEGRVKGVKGLRFPWRHLLGVSV